MYSDSSLKRLNASEHNGDWDLCSSLARLPPANRRYFRCAGVDQHWRSKGKTGEAGSTYIRSSLYVNRSATQRIAVLMVSECYEKGAMFLGTDRNQISTLPFEDTSGPFLKAPGYMNGFPRLSMYSPYFPLNGLGGSSVPNGVGIPWYSPFFTQFKTCRFFCVSKSIVQVGLFGNCALAKKYAQILLNDQYDEICSPCSFRG